MDIDQEDEPPLLVDMAADEGESIKGEPSIKVPITIVTGR